MNWISWIEYDFKKMGMTVDTNSRRVKRNNKTLLWLCNEDYGKSAISLYEAHIAPMERRGLL